jgi:hypothetical protein
MLAVPFCDNIHRPLRRRYLMQSGNDDSRHDLARHLRFVRWLPVSRIHGHWNDPCFAMAAMSKKLTLTPNENSSDEQDAGKREVPLAAYTIREFCEAHRISETMFFKLRNAGLGPREMRVLRKVIISIEAAAEWRRERENPRHRRRDNALNSCRLCGATTPAAT